MGQRRIVHSALVSEGGAGGKGARNRGRLSFASMRTLSSLASLPSLALLASLALGAFVTGCADEESTSGTTGVACADDAAAACLASQGACAPSGTGCVACAEGSYSPTGHACQSLGTASYSHDFATFEVAAGEERLGQCQSWTLNNAEEIWVQAVELVQDEASHHSNWTFVPSDQFEGPDGVWPCDDRGATRSCKRRPRPAACIYAQSTQAAHEVQKFPERRRRPHPALFAHHRRRPPAQRHERATRRATRASRIYGIPAKRRSDGEARALPPHGRHGPRDPPEIARSRFAASCELDAKFAAFKAPDSTWTIYYTFCPTTHALGRRMSFGLDVVARQEGRPAASSTSVAFDGEAHGIMLDASLQGGRRCDGPAPSAASSTNPRDDADPLRPRRSGDVRDARLRRRRRWPSSRP
jgi:hypothetical protein